MQKFSGDRALKALFGLNNKLIQITENHFARRANKRRKDAERRKKRGLIVEWTLDFLWTVGFVFLLNQYLLQSYMIPSGSMIPNLLIGDYLFVERWSYGAQLFPGVDVKLPGLTTAKRGDIITFENPDFVSKGMVHDTAQRLLFLLTLSLVDLDRDPESGDPAVRLLVKRLLGDENTLVRLEKGEPLFQPKNLGRWINEADFNKMTNVDFPHQRLVKSADYRWYSDYAWGQVLYGQGLAPQSATQPPAGLQNSQYSDSEELRRLFQKYKAILYPTRMTTEKQIAMTLESDRYIPEGYVLPMGDNRDNSLDGRYFGLIPKYKLQGKALFRFFPLSRMGAL